MVTKWLLVLSVAEFAVSQRMSHDYNHPSNYIEPQDMGVPSSWDRVPGFFGNMPYSDSPIAVYSAGYRVEQSFHSPGRSYGFGIEDRRVLERSRGMPRGDHEPIIVHRPFEGTMEVFPLTGRVVHYGPRSTFDQPMSQAWPEMARAAKAFQQNYPLSRGPPPATRF